MEAIILAGGLGKRLRQLVPDLPKPMAPVAGRPFLEILLFSLKKKGFRRVVLSLGYMAEKVVAYFKSRRIGLELVYAIEDIPLGTGGGIRQALHHCQSEHVFVFNGDTYIDIEAREVEMLWQKSRIPIIVGCRVEDTTRYGRLKVDNGQLIGFSEKGIAGPGLINAGTYVLPVDILDDFPRGKRFSFEEDFLVQSVFLRRFNLFVSNSNFIDIGTPEDYNRAQTELVKLRNRLLH